MISGNRPATTSPAPVHRCVRVCAHASAHQHLCTQPCAHVSVHACTHPHTPAYMHVRMHAHQHTCMYACTHVSIHACPQARTSACMHVRMHACWHTCMYTCTHISIHACPHARTSAYIYVRMDTRQHTCMYTCTHISRHACTHVSIHTCTQPHTSSYTHARIAITNTCMHARIHAFLPGISTRQSVRCVSRADPLEPDALFASTAQSTVAMQSPVCCSTPLAHTLRARAVKAGSVKNHHPHSLGDICEAAFPSNEQRSSNL